MNIHTKCDTSFGKVVVFVQGVFSGRVFVHSGRESQLLAAIWPLSKPAQLHSRRDPLKPGASFLPTPFLLSWQFSSPRIKCLSVSQDGAGCDLKCQNSVFSTMRVFSLFSGAQSVLVHCFKPLLCLDVCALSILSFPRNVQLGGVLSSQFALGVLPLLSLVPMLSGVRWHHEPVFFLKLIPVGFCSNIGVTWRPSCLQLNCALVSDKNPVKMKDEHWAVRCTTYGKYTPRLWGSNPADRQLQTAAMLCSWGKAAKYDLCSTNMVQSSTCSIS